MNGKLLLADASPAIQRVVALMFASEGVQVVAVSDGEEAIQRFPVERPDIVLANIGTARRSGYDVAAFVKTHPELSHVPVLLLASAFEPVDEERARQVKSAGILVKPFEPQQVIARVRDLIPSRTSRSAVAGGAAAAPASPDPVPAAAPVAGPATSISEPDARVPSLESRTANPDSRIPSDGSPVASPEPRVPDPESRIPVPEPRVPDPGSRIPAPDSPHPTASAGRGGSLDDYFDRLDAALTSRSASRPAPPTPLSVPAEDDATEVKIPSIDDVLGPDPERDGAHVAPADSGPVVAPGEVPAAGSGPVPVAITDELVDRIAQRVVDRMSGDTAKQLLAGLVERLVREELAGGQLE